MNIQQFLNQSPSDIAKSNPVSRDYSAIGLYNPKQFIEGGMLKLTKGIGLDSAVYLSRQDEATSAFLHTPCREVRTPSKETYIPRRTGETLATGQEGLRQTNDFEECNLPTYQQVVEEYYNGM